MSATMSQARDEMFAAVKSAWDSAQGGPYPMQWPNVEDAATPPDTATPWARTTLRHSLGGQDSLAGAQGKQRWRREGVLTVQVFTPVGDGSEMSYNLVQLLVDALQGATTASGVWFRNVRGEEIGEDGDFYQINVLAEFVYDQIT